MDAVVLFLIGLYFLFNYNRERSKVITTKVVPTLNPDYYKDENAFMEIYNELTGKR